MASTGLGPEGMRKSGSVEKEDGDSPAALTSLDADLNREE